MFVYEKKLQYPVKIKNTNPKLAALIISQYGGPYPHKLRKHPISGCFRVIPIKQMRGPSASHLQPVKEPQLSESESWGFPVIWMVTNKYQC